MKKLAIIIPHYNGEEILQNCIHSLYQSTFKDFNIFLVDNGSSDNSIKNVEAEFPDVKIISSDVNLGYAGGCNLGAEKSDEPYLLFYNNDTELEPDALSHMVNQIETDESIGALQPKLISYQNKQKYDYSGACGGELDYLGYPFARGRIFDFIEDNNGQYDQLDPNIFWASGTAMMLRRKAIDEVGLLDHDFFAHMEEIDLSWRMHLQNWKVQICASAIVYHYSGYTLGAMNPQKMYLNHRNNLFMLYKNVEQEQLISVFIKRFTLEFITIVLSLIKFDFKRASSVVKALFSFLTMKKKFKKKREAIQANILNKNLPVYPKSIVSDYFFKKKKKYSQI